MSSPRSALALRKELLVAQSALYRAQLRHEFVALTARPRISRVALFGIFTWLAGRTRAARWIAMAGQAIAVVKMVRKALGTRH
jgi:hypothetical protein